MTIRYRAQVQGVNGWVDGGLFVKREDAVTDGVRLAALYQAPTRVIEETTP
jgi:hypothetical protein